MSLSESIWVYYNHPELLAVVAAVFAAVGLFGLYRRRQPDGE